MLIDADTELERVFREQHERLWRALVGFAGDPHLASDAAAEAFGQLAARGEGVRDPAAWVWRAAFRIASGELKSRRDLVPLPDHAYEPKEPASEVIAALALLSPKQRAAVILHHYAGYPTREIAAMLDTSVGAVRVHLSTGRRRLRTFLEEHDEGS